MSNQSLIIFAKLPRPGEVKTRLGSTLGMERAVGIYREFAEHAFTLADDLGRRGVSTYLFYAPGASKTEVKGWVCRDFVFHEQQGDSLGERMHQAFAKTFQDGADASVIIGTDVPELRVERIRSAYDALVSHDLVIGPSTDGGYYLLGMNGPLKKVFENVEWSTDSVFRATMNTVRAHGYSCHVLPDEKDIDTEEDYKAFLQRTQRG
jgi:hypothetical protein